MQKRASKERHLLVKGNSAYSRAELIYIFAVCTGLIRRRLFRVNTVRFVRTAQALTLQLIG